MRKTIGIGEIKLQPNRWGGHWVLSESSEEAKEYFDLTEKINDLHRRIDRIRPYIPFDLRHLAPSDKYVLIHKPNDECGEVIFLQRKLAYQCTRCGKEFTFYSYSYRERKEYAYSDENELFMGHKERKRLLSELEALKKELESATKRKKEVLQKLAEKIKIVEETEERIGKKVTFNDGVVLFYSDEPYASYEDKSLGDAAFIYTELYELKRNLF